MGKAVNIRNVPEDTCKQWQELSKQAKQATGIKQGELFAKMVELMQKHDKIKK